MKLSFFEKQSIYGAKQYTLDPFTAQSIKDFNNNVTEKNWQFGWEQPGCVNSQEHMINSGRKMNSGTSHSHSSTLLIVVSCGIIRVPDLKYKIRVKHKVAFLDKCFRKNNMVLQRNLHCRLQILWCGDLNCLCWGAYFSKYCFSKRTDWLCT